MLASGHEIGITFNREGARRRCPEFNSLVNSDFEFWLETILQNLLRIFARLALD